MRRQTAPRRESRLRWLNATWAQILPLLRPHLPHTERPIRSSRHGEPAIRRQVHTQDRFLVQLDAVSALSAVEVPPAGRMIVAAGQRLPAIRCKADTAHIARMSL